jgi:hypothetical protein
LLQDLVRLTLALLLQSKLYVVENENLKDDNRIFLCLDLIIWFVATLQLFAAFERLGPKLVMIFNTVCY